MQATAQCGQTLLEEFGWSVFSVHSGLILPDSHREGRAEKEEYEREYIVDGSGSCPQV